MAKIIHLKPRTLAEAANDLERAIALVAMFNEMVAEMNRREDEWKWIKEALALRSPPCA